MASRPEPIARKTIGDAGFGFHNGVPAMQKPSLEGTFAFVNNIYLFYQLTWVRSATSADLAAVDAQVSSLNVLDTTRA